MSVKPCPNPNKEKRCTAANRFKIKTVGNKWSYLQASEFNTNSQPFYVLLDHNGQPLSEGVGYDPDPEVFVDFLERGLQQFQK
jgi:thiol:disulfide interchange protein DsbD